MTIRRAIAPLPPTLTLLLFVAASAVSADELDHDQVKQLRDHGQIVSLAELLENTHQRLPGVRILAVELAQHDDGQLVYEIELLDANNTVLEHYYDARNGELLTYEVYQLDSQGRLIGLEYDARTGTLLEREVKQNVKDEDEDEDEDH